MTQSELEVGVLLLKLHHLVGQTEQVAFESQSHSLLTLVRHGEVVLAETVHQEVYEGTFFQEVFLKESVLRESEDFPDVFANEGVEEVVPDLFEHQVEQQEHHLLGTQDLLDYFILLQRHAQHDQLDYIQVVGA